MWNHNNYSRKFWDNSKCKCDQGKAILDGIALRVSKIIYKDICMKVHGLSSAITIAANTFSSNLKTHKSQNFLIIAPQGVA